MGKLTNMLYNTSRNINKIASTVNDIETLLTGNPKKIVKRAKRKTVGKTLNKINRSIIKKLQHKYIIILKQLSFQSLKRQTLINQKLVGEKLMLINLCSNGVLDKAQTRFVELTLIS